MSPAASPPRRASSPRSRCSARARASRRARAPPRRPRWRVAWRCVVCVCARARASLSSRCACACVCRRGGVCVCACLSAVARGVVRSDVATVWVCSRDRRHPATRPRDGARRPSWPSPPRHRRVTATLPRDREMARVVLRGRRHRRVTSMPLPRHRTTERWRAGAAPTSLRRGVVCLRPSDEDARRAGSTGITQKRR